MILPCPEGYFCPYGTYTPQKCSPGAPCPVGTYYNMSFLPLAVLLTLDILIAVGLLVWKIKEFFARRKRSHRPSPKGILKRAGTIIEMARRNNGSYYSLEGSDHSMAEGRISSLRRANTFEAAMEPDFSPDEDFVSDDKPTSELQLFVQSLSRCMDTTKFGLSFDFENLEFKPRKADKPILSEVTGSIPYGSFCAVMGGSGAGKCKLAWKPGAL